MNDAVQDDPSLVNTDCYGAWLVEAAIADEEKLLSAAEYEAFING